MRTIIITILLLFLISFFTQGQQQPIDTMFYPNGDLKAIKYRIGERYNNGTIRYFKNSANKLDKNRPLVDTIYDNRFANKKDWTHYDGGVRIFLHNKSNVLIRKSTKYGSRNDSAFKRITGAYCFLLRELGDLEICMSYNIDTNILSMRIKIYDSIRRGTSFKEHFFRSFYQEGTIFQSGEGYHVFKCGNHGTLELEFSSDNLLNKIYFYPNDKNKLATYYEFYNNLFCKKYGFLSGRLRAGEWYEYYENGNISSVGNYEIYETDGVRNYRKVGLWQYFNKDGTNR